MSTHRTPRYTANELAKGGIVSRRDVLKGALMGCGALAAMAVPMPFTRFFPAVAPREAMGANNNVADGIYLFRYNAAKEWSLGIRGGVSNWTPISLNATSGSIHSPMLRRHLRQLFRCVHDRGSARLQHDQPLQR